jgi:hypothetical protein
MAVVGIDVAPPYLTACLNPAVVIVVVVVVVDDKDEDNDPLYPA